MDNPTTITLSDIATGAVFSLDLACMGGCGKLRRPLNDLAKICLHRMGVLFSVEDTGHAWRVSVRRRGSRERMPQPGRFFATAAEAENHFLFTIVESLPPVIKAALRRSKTA